MCVLKQGLAEPSMFDGKVVKCKPSIVKSLPHVSPNTRRVIFTHTIIFVVWRKGKVGIADNLLLLINQDNQQWGIHCAPSCNPRGRIFVSHIQYCAVHLSVCVIYTKCNTQQTAHAEV